MTQEEFAKHRQYVSEPKPSMQRRRIGHDYTSRRIYLITMTTEGRRPLFGKVIGEMAVSGFTAGAVRFEPSPLGQRVQEEWFAVTAHHPEATALSLQLMPDHLHGILFVERPMQQHLGAIISGFKASTNKAYRQLVLGQEAAAAPQHSDQTAAAASSPAAPAPAASSPAAPAPAASAPAVPAASAPAVPAASSPAVPAASSPAVPAAFGSVGYAAAPPQSKRDRSHENRQHGMLWSPNYNDHILSNEGELERWRQYLADNPRRLFLRRQYPDLFRVAFGLRIGRFTCSAVGNRFLLGYPRIMQVQCSTHFYEEDIQKAMSRYMAAARSGTVLVSPSISEGEKRTMRAAFDASLPVIYISANGLGSYSKPGGAFFNACAEGRLLILSPYEHQNRKVQLTRSICMEMNELARLIAEGAGAAAAPQHSQQTAAAALSTAALAPAVPATSSPAAPAASAPAAPAASSPAAAAASAPAVPAVSASVGYAAAPPQPQTEDPKRKENDE